MEFAIRAIIPLEKHVAEESWIKSMPCVSGFEYQDQTYKKYVPKRSQRIDVVQGSGRTWWVKDRVSTGQYITIQ